MVPSFPPVIRAPSDRPARSSGNSLSLHRRLRPTIRTCCSYLPRSAGRRTGTSCGARAERRSHYGRKTWTRLLGGLPDGQRALFGAMTLASHENGMSLFAGDSDGQIFESTPRPLLVIADCRRSRRAISTARCRRAARRSPSSTKWPSTPRRSRRSTRQSSRTSSQHPQSA